MLARLAVAEKVDIKAFFYGQRHRDLAVRHGKRIGFLAYLNSTIGQIGRVSQTGIGARYLHAGDRSIPGWRCGNRNYLTDAVCPAAADVNAAVRGYGNHAGSRFGSCGQRKITGAVARHSYRDGASCIFQRQHNTTHGKLRRHLLRFDCRAG